MLRPLTLAALALSACAQFGGSPAVDAQREIDELVQAQREREEAREKADQERADALMAQVTAEARERDEADKRRQLCRARWSERDLKEAETEASKAQGAPPEEGVAQRPSKLHERFAKFAATLEEQSGKGCEVTGRERFEQSWAFLQGQEADRARRLVEHHARVAAEEERAAAERAAFEQNAKDEAKKRGFKGALLGASLTDVLNSLVQEGRPVSELKGIAIEVGRLDEEFTALQGLGNGAGLFTSNQTEARVWFTAKGSAVYEGTPLMSLLYEDVPFVVVTGVKSYRNVAGAATQAFVVKPAW